MRPPGFLLAHGHTLGAVTGAALGRHWDADVGGRPGGPVPVLTFAMLGPLEVRRSGQPLALGPRRHAELLCLLLTRPRTVVPAETLAEELWDGEPPATAANTLQGYVAGLRRALEPDRAPRERARVLVTHPVGYSLEVEDAAVDALAFRAELARARALAATDAAAAAADVLRAGLGRWRGPALADVRDATWAVPVVRSLEEDRLAAQELLAELTLATRDDVADVVPGLQRLLADHPLRERTAVLLMRALYRSGRQAEALGVARQVRSLLADELGVDPGPDLQEAELAILRQDNAFLGPATTGSMRPPSSPAPLTIPADDVVPGRARELAALLAAAGRARAGTAAAVLVTGEPGIGKTRLVEGLLAQLPDFRVLAGRCTDLEGVPAYWPWRQVLSPLGAAPSVTSEQSRVEQALALAERLREHGAEQPVVVVLEDLQWADVPSLELLELLLADAAGSRLLLVLTARGPVVEPRLTRVLAALGRHPRAVRVELAGLDADAVRACVGEVTGSQPDPELAASIQERSGGNPFFARELARLLDDDGRLRPGVPAAVLDVLRLRTVALPEPSRDLLAAGAILGRDFAARTAGAMLDLDADDAVPAVEAALDAGLLVEPLPGRLRFSHSLVHEAVRAGISGVRAQTLHARAARALVEREQPPAGVLAHHLLHAHDVAGIEAALTAAAEDLDQLAVQPALELLDHAATVAQTVDAGPRLTDRLALLRGIALARLGQLDESQRLLVATAEGASTRGDHELLARAALALAADGAVAGYWAMLAPLTDGEDVSVRWLERALAVGTPDGPTSVALRSALATQLAVRGRPDLGLAERSVADAQDLDVDHRFRALTARWATLWTPRHAHERLEVARELVALAGRHVQRQLAARHLLTTALLEVGDLAASDAEFTALAEAVERHRDPDFALLARWWHAMRALMSGDLAGAEAVATELHSQLSGASGRASAAATVSLSTVSGIVAWERGELGRAAADLDAQALTRHPGMQSVRALAHAQNGDPAAVHRILDEAFGPDLHLLGDDATA
ncbi:MAG TPA: BTAD domain-containing putative transcriptional regulator, partial [Motilibacteraceae bacterium]|nr:BTAD domain-containing putative transcriptional regulator [Motilibacteraceae bacterium]